MRCYDICMMLSDLFILATLDAAHFMGRHAAAAGSAPTGRSRSPCRSRVRAVPATDRDPTVTVVVVDTRNHIFKIKLHMQVLWHRHLQIALFTHVMFVLASSMHQCNDHIDQHQKHILCMQSILCMHKLFVEVLIGVHLCDAEGVPIGVRL